MAFSYPIKQKLIEILGSEWVKDDPITLYSYRCDGLTIHTREPIGVIFPAGTRQLSEIVKLFNEHSISFLPRGAGTGLSGGAIPNGECVIIEMFRFNMIHDVNLQDRTATVGPGMVNLKLSKAVEKHNLYFVPDPSSQKACTIGGNVAENAGGPHTLKYGVTVNHVLGMEIVMANGDIRFIGNDFFGSSGPDMTGLFVGSEGTFGIVTKVICRLTPLPEKIKTILAIFSDLNDCSATVGAVIRAGIIPAAMELIDKVVIGALEKTLKPGFPTDAEAVLIIELEDLEECLDDEVEKISAILRENNVVDVKVTGDAEERALIWKSRKEAFGAIGAITPAFYTQDGVVPRSKLPHILKFIESVGQKYDLKTANVFHAGDGNLHPLILYNPYDEGVVERVVKAGEEIMTECVNCGGTLSGEHGIGLEKKGLMKLIHTDEDLENFASIRLAFNPDEILNPDKILPTPGKCGEVKFINKKSGAAA